MKYNDINDVIDAEPTRVFTEAMRQPRAPRRSRSMNPMKLQHQDPSRDDGLPSKPVMLLAVAFILAVGWGSHKYTHDSAEERLMKAVEAKAATPAVKGASRAL